MNTTAQSSKYWIGNPATDLILFCFGWIPVFLSLIVFKEHMGFIILFVLMFTSVHRHYTFALVYGEKEENEKGTLHQSRPGKVILSLVGDYLGYLTLISYFLLAVAVFFTLLFVYQEFKNRHQLSTAKVLYVFSTLLLYFIFFHSLVVGYIVFGFSHALEYIAFVNIFVNSKYKKKPDSMSPLAMASKKLWLYSALFSIGILVLSLLGMKLNENAFLIYIVGSSFLHFIYDGLIWKVRRPEVGKPFDIKYAST